MHDRLNLNEERMRNEGIFSFAKLLILYFSHMQIENSHSFCYANILNWPELGLIDCCGFMQIDWPFNHTTIGLVQSCVDQKVNLCANYTGILCLIDSVLIEKKTHK